MDFETAFPRLINTEAGYQDDPRDRGNWTSGTVNIGQLVGTKYGISAMSYPMEDIRNLTLERAKLLYRRDFWGAAGCDAVPDGVRFDLFDTAVNSGVKTAVRLLQQTVGETPDGILGPRTLQAVSSMDPIRLLARFNGQRLDYMNALPAWPIYGKGWAQRIADNLKVA